MTKTRFKDAEVLLIQRKQATKEGKKPEIKHIENRVFWERVNLKCVFILLEQDQTKISDVVRSFKTALRRSGIKDFRFHDLSIASHYGGNRRNHRKRATRAQGHKNDLRYAHLAPSHKVKAVDTLDSVLTNKRTIQKVYNFRKSQNG